MDLRWECARRTAALLRAECAEVLAAEGAAQRLSLIHISRPSSFATSFLFSSTGSAMAVTRTLPPNFKNSGR